MDRYRLLASITGSLEGTTPPLVFAPSTVEVTAVLRHGLVLRLPHGVEGFLSSTHLAGTPGVTDALLRHYAASFGTLDFAVVPTALALENDTVTVSALATDVLPTTSVIAAAMYDRLRLCAVVKTAVGEAARLVGRVVPARVVSISTHGAVVSLPSGLHGVALCGPSAVEKDSDVIVRILDVDMKTSMVDVSVDKFRPNHIYIFLQREKQQ